MQVTQKTKVFASPDGKLIYRTGPGEYAYCDIAQLAGDDFTALVSKVAGIEAGADDVTIAAVLAAITTSGSGAPGTTPSAIGLFYVDTAAGTLYVSKGTSSSADWSAAGAGLTGAQLKIAYEGEADTNEFSDAEQTLLGNQSGTNSGDMSDADVKTAYENNADSNEFSDAEQTKLGNIETAADVTDAANVNAVESDPIVGAITGLVKADGAGNIAQAVEDTDYQGVPSEGAFADGDKTKLDAIEALADVTDLTNVVAALITSGAGAPGTTPTFVGQTYIDTTADKVYIATDTASSGDWTLMTSA